mgnify:CR=1 FL=1
MNQEKIILPGGAGLVGQNLVVRLKERGYNNLIVLDKHRANLEVLRQLHPDIVVEYADLAEPGEWQRHFSQARAVVMLQAQIGGNDYIDFERNNLTSTRLILDAIKAGQNDIKPIKIRPDQGDAAGAIAGALGGRLGGLGGFGRKKKDEPAPAAQQQPAAGCDASAPPAAANAGGDVGHRWRAGCGGGDEAGQRHWLHAFHRTWR